MPFPKGRRNPCSPETRAKISASKKGHRHTEESKAKMRGPRGKITAAESFRRSIRFIRLGRMAELWQDPAFRAARLSQIQRQPRGPRGHYIPRP